MHVLSAAIQLLQVPKKNLEIPPAVATKMTRVRISPDLLAICAARNVWFILESTLAAPGWPLVEVVQQTCDARDYWLGVTLASAYNVSTTREASTDPIPEPGMSTDSSIIFLDDED